MNTAHPGDDALVAFALDDMAPADWTGVSAHVEACESCRKVVGRLRAALQAYREEQPPEAPARLLADLLAAQAEQRTRGEVRARWLRPALAAAALIVAAGIFASGFWAGRSTAPSGEASGAAVSPRDSSALPPARLPRRPAIEFRAEPPLEAHLALAAGMAPDSGHGRGGRRDSL